MVVVNFNIFFLVKFDFKIDDWDYWIKCYELFEVVMECDELLDKVCINMFIYVMGNNVVDIYDSFKLLGEDI